MAMLDDDKETTRAIRVRILAYTAAAGYRYYTGTIGRGGGGSP
jgi:hypothetical protein